MKNVLVVGASLAGVHAAEALRREGFDGRITIIGAEDHAPYDRPPLSKEILRGDWEADRIVLRQAGFEGLDVDEVYGRKAVSLEPTARKLGLDDGRSLDYDGLVIATGASVRRLPALEMLEGVYTLRTLDDALAIRRALRSGPRVVVVGAGFIGLEVAASCRELGLDVAVVEPLDVPLAGSLGPEMGAHCASLHRDRGVELHLGRSVSGVEGGARVERVVLDDGSRIEADLVIVGVGVKPNTGWLEDSGLRLDDGVVCDETCATGAPGVVAAGDVARWMNPRFGESMRVEHWDNAVEQGVAAARRLLHGPSVSPYAPVPMFWSDQHGIKIQFAGRSRPGDQVRVVHGDPADFRFTALYGREGRLTAVLTFKRPRHLIKLADMIAAGASWDEALAVEL